MDIVANFEAVRARLQGAAREFRLGEAPPEPAIIAVGKTHGPERMLPLLQHGHRIFGENRVQEAQAKWPALKAGFPDIELHLIGPLQTNKAKEAAALFDVIETLDRPKLAETLARIMDHESRITNNQQLKTNNGFPDLFIQVNTGEEPQKAGVLPKEADVFIRDWVERLKLPVVGLMCIPPAGEAPGPHFALLRTIAERNGLPCLSMGMSGDYVTAAALGATHVRIGSAIFGERG